MDSRELASIAASTGDDDAVVALAAVARLRREAERVEAVLVRRARNRGATWAEIAAALGVTKQAVHKKHRGRRLPGRES